MPNEVRVGLKLLLPSSGDICEGIPAVYLMLRSCPGHVPLDIGNAN